jgi:hypothetical protein
VSPQHPSSSPKTPQNGPQNPKNPASHTDGPRQNATDRSEACLRRHCREGHARRWWSTVDDVGYGIGYAALWLLGAVLSLWE